VYARGNPTLTPQNELIDKEGAMAKRNWTEVQRNRQREAIQASKPWQKSTGPTSDEGKAVASQNANQGGLRPQLRALSQALRSSRLALADLTVKVTS
jgi:hypothetical protein